MGTWMSMVLLLTLWQHRVYLILLKIWCFQYYFPAMCEISQWIPAKPDKTHFISISIFIFCRLILEEHNCLILMSYLVAKRPFLNIANIYTATQRTAHPPNHPPPPHTHARAH